MKITRLQFDDTQFPYTGGVERGELKRVLGSSTEELFLTFETDGPVDDTVGRMAERHHPTPKTAVWTKAAASMLGYGHVWFDKTPEEVLALINAAIPKIRKLANARSLEVLVESFQRLRSEGVTNGEILTALEKVYG